MNNSQAKIFLIAIAGMNIAGEYENIHEWLTGHTAAISEMVCNVSNVMAYWPISSHRVAGPLLETCAMGF